MNNLDCANCAAKMERAISRIDGVESASVGFMTRRLIIEAEESDLDAILDKAQSLISKYEKDCKIVR